MWLFKLLGLLIILTVCSGIGVLKSELLRKQADDLAELIKGLSQLSELVRIGNYEIDELVNICFKKSLGFFENGEFIINCHSLTEAQGKIIKEYFSGFGFSDTEGEHSRTELYINMLKNEQSEALKRYSALGSLYRSVGFMGGLIICIFLL